MFKLNNFVNFFVITMILASSLTTSLSAQQPLFLKENLKRAKPGDFIATAQNKTYSVLHIYDKKDNILTIEEISVPMGKFSLKNFSWKRWVEQNAPKHTSWVMYNIDLNTAQMKEYFSFTKNGWYDMPQRDNFLSTLLNLRLEKIPPQERKKIGFNLSGNDRKGLWQPRMIVNGKAIEGVSFDAWRTHWPKDGTELSGKLIEVYVPEENEKYPSYFPYWLQISGMIGNAKVRIIDSGTQLVSPAPPLQKNDKH